MLLVTARRGLFQSRAVLRATPALATAAPALIGARRTLCNSLFELSDDIDVDSVSYGFMASQAIFCALEVGVYEAVAGAGEGGLTADALKTACSINAPRLQTLLTSLTAIKSLKRNAATGAYTLSPNSARYLVQSSRQYYGDYLRYQMGRQFYHRMGALPDVMTTGEAPSYASWFSDPATAAMYTQAQHNGSVATAKYLVKKKLQLGSVTSMLDVGGGSGAFSYVIVKRAPDRPSFCGAICVPHCPSLPPYSGTSSSRALRDSSRQSSSCLRCARRATASRRSSRPMCRHASHSSSSTRRSPTGR